MNYKKLLITIFTISYSLNGYSFDLENFSRDDLMRMRASALNAESNSRESRYSPDLNSLTLKGKALGNKIEADFDSKKFQEMLNNPYLKASGGFSTGGGGNGVVCFSKTGNLTEVSLLDYYEGIRRDNSLVKAIDLPGDSVDEKIVSAFSRIQKDYPRLSLKLKNRALWLSQNIETHLIDSKDGKLSPVYDMNIPFVPQFNEQGDECQIVRFAVQSKEQVQGQKKFFFVKDLYNHPLTSDNTRAGIILHEIIYEEAIKNNAVDSDFVRWVTYLISSKKAEQMSSNEIQGLQYQPGGEFLGSLGVEVNPRRVMSYDFTDIKARERVYALEIYNIDTSRGGVSCYKLGVCELLDGEFLGRKRGSSDFLPKFNIMMRSNTLKVPLSDKVIEKRRGENTILSNDNIANREESICTRSGACVGALVGVTNETRYANLSYTGVIVGIFGDGNFAIELIGGRFDIIGQEIDLNQQYDNDKKVILYADKSTVSY